MEQNLITTAELAEFFSILIEDKPHKHQKATVDLASEYTAYATGVGLDKRLKRFVRRESAETFKQRTELTQEVCSGVVNNIFDILQKAPRANYTIKLRYSDGDEKGSKKNDITKLTTDFWLNRGVDGYLCERIIEFNKIDPNSFCVIEWADYPPNEYFKPYPFEVYSENVHAFKYVGEVLQYLTVSFLLSDGKTRVMTHYGKNMTSKAVALSEPPLNVVLLQNIAVQDPMEEGVYYLKTATATWKVKAMTPHNADMVPAIPFGYVADLSNRRQTKVAPHERIMPVLRKTLKVNSELDLSMTLAAFPLPVATRDACNNKGCVNGTLSSDGSMCPKCKGSGFVKPSSVMEEITFKRPRDKEEQIDLTKVMHYVTPPIELLKFMDEYIEKKTKQAIQVMFNSEIFTRSEIAETATGKNISLQNVYDTLLKLARHIEFSWSYITKFIARVSKLDAGLEANLSFSTDFKLKGINDIIEEIKTANDSDASPFAIEALQGELMNLMFDEIELQRYETIQSFNPFAGMNKEQVALLMTTNYVPLRQKVLYANLNRIVKELEVEHMGKGGGFYQLGDKGEAISKKLDAIMDEISQQQPTIQL
jgi:hypothetical protein